jgi:phosphonate transport system permease protein
MAPEPRTPGLPRRPFPLGARGALFVLLVLAGVLSAHALGLFAGPHTPGAAGFTTLGDFFSRALSPALRSEAPPPFGGVSLLPDIVGAIFKTVVFAAAALALGIVLGGLLGVLGSTAWWPGGGLRGRLILGLIYGAARVVIALLRSIHELIWAVLFLAALGRSDLSAVVAIAIPISGTLAKIISELIDEAPRDAAAALDAAGAGPVAVLGIGLIPRALPDITATVLYQFECALRSSAILGFFGFPTIGYYLSASFENLYYGEVWTWLYTLVLLVVLVEWWSGEIRRRLQ